MNIPVILGGVVALYLIAQNSASGATTLDNLPDGPKIITVPRNVLGAQLAAYKSAVDDLYETGNLDGVTQYANYKYVESALTSLGYDVNVFDDASINAIVYRVSVYFWYYQLQSIGKKDDAFIMDDTGAAGVIDEWAKFLGYGIAGFRYNNQKAKFNQSSYILGANTNYNVGIVETILMVAQYAIDAWNWLNESGFFQMVSDLFKNPAEIVEDYFIEWGMDEVNALNISKPIYPNHGYWDSAVMFHVYLVEHPSFLPEFTPKYKY